MFRPTFPSCWRFWLAVCVVFYSVPPSLANDGLRLCASKSSSGSSSGSTCEQRLIVKFKVGDGTFGLFPSARLNSTVNVSLYLDGGDTRASSVHLLTNTSALSGEQVQPVKVRSNNAGSRIGRVRANCTSTTCPFENLNVTLGAARFVVVVSFVKSSQLDTIIDVIGWIYFAAWSVSFYPQVWSNFRRKSVVGLDFNFLTLNIFGFICYSVYNCALFFSPSIQQEFYAEEPYSQIPVQPEDVAFGLHAIAITLFTIAQCVVYERGEQRVSRMCMLLLGIFGVFVIISLGLVGGHVINWYRFVQFVSYIKIAITLLKYIPQAFYNWRRKSTVGWSIGNVLLDFTGGSFSLLNLFLVAYNYDDWAGQFSDFTKFALGFISICFDVLFVVQHYILYRGRTPYLHADSNDSDFLYPTGFDCWAWTRHFRTRRVRDDEVVGREQAAVHNAAES